MKEFADPGKVEIKVGPDDIATMQASDIVGRLVPEWLAGFLAKNRKYREVDNSLGAKGVFPDIWRKVGILKSRIWLGHEEIGEPSREVIQDLIGHLFLMLFMMDDDELSEDRDMGILEGQGYALDRAADRMARRDGRNHVYDSLMNCTACGYGHVGPDSTMYATMCPGPRSAQRSADDVIQERIIARQNLLDAVINAERGHRPSEWEAVAKQLASAASIYMKVFGSDTTPLAEAWEQGYLAADNGHDNDNPYMR